MIERRDPYTNLVRVNPHKSPTRKKSHGMIDDLDNVDFISSNVHSSRKEALLYIFEDNEAVIKMIIRGRGPTVRHVSRTRRAALDWFFDRINLDPKIQIRYIDTKNQLADILTRGNFTRDEWTHLLRFFFFSQYQHVQLCQLPSNSVEKDTGRNRRRMNYGKVKTDVEPGFEDCSKHFKRAEFECIEDPGDTQSTLSKLESCSMCGETCS